MLLWLALACKSTEDTAPNAVDADRDGYTTEIDCKDDDPDAFPGAEERCNGLDDDCDRAIDEGVSGDLRYRDADGDGFGDSLDSSDECGELEGYAADGGDCNDGDDTVFPGADEICDGEDQDCDEVPDNGAGGTTIFPDEDEDGFGDTARGTDACDVPEGWTETGGDCDDADDDAWPGAPERCDGMQNDCARTWSADDETGARLHTHHGDSDVTFGSTPVELTSGSTLYLCGGSYAGTVHVSGDAAIVGTNTPLFTSPGVDLPFISVDSGVSLTVDGVSFTSHGVSGDGTAIDADVGSAVTVTHCELTDLVAAGDGGAIYALGALVIESSTFSANTATSGGAVYCGDDCEIRDSGFDGNVALGFGNNYGGGAVYLAGGGSISGSDLEDNTAGAGRGGGLLVTGADDVVLDDVSIARNTAYYAGGLDAGTTGTVAVTGASFVDNVASGPALSGGGQQGGGGIRVYRGTVRITDTLIEGNIASSGGGITIATGTTAAALTLGAGTFVTSNLANGGALDTDSPVGGGIFALGSGVTITLDGAEISSNSVSSSFSRGLGGGLAIQSGAAVSCTDGIIAANTAATRGGGAYLSDAVGTSLSSVSCDFGTGATDNSPDDVNADGAYPYGVATFTCDGAGCL